MRVILYLFIILFCFVGETSSNEKKKDLLELKKLLDAGTINAEEFDAAKKIINDKNYEKKLLETKKAKETVNKKIIKNSKKEKEIVNTKISSKEKQKSLQQSVKKIDIDENLKQEIENQIEKEKNIKCLKYTKKDPFLFAKLKKEYPSLKNKNYTQLNYCIKKSDILKLKIPNDFEPPQELLSDLKGCKSNLCFEKLAAKKVFEIFVRRGEEWNARYPGDMIIGMAWFEIMFNGNLRKNKKILARYERDKYEGLMKLQKTDDEKKIFGLINMNNGRIKMREALGFTMFDNTRDVIDGQLLLGNFLNKDKLKSIKVDISPEMRKKKY